MKLALVALLVLAPLPAASQSLGDAAAKEKARRQEQESKKKAKAYSNEDLGPAAPKDAKPKTEVETEATPPRPLENVRPAASPEEVSWRQRAEAARAKAKSAQDQVAALEAQARQLLSDRIASTDTNQILKLMAEQKEVLDQVERAKEDAQAAAKELEDFEESARAAHIPQGWLEPAPPS
jgi:hypothetical protein